MRQLLKKVLRAVNIDPAELYEAIGVWSLRMAPSRNLSALTGRLREIVPDISKQYSVAPKDFDTFHELKTRTQQAFQCSLLLKAIEQLSAKRKLTVVDIGDSSGTHMLYLKELSKGRFDIDTISVNLDPMAIEKIRKRGLKAILCRAEELDLGEQGVDLFTSFQMVEHLHNPALFLYRLSKKSECNRIILTVPYLRSSRVGLYSLRNKPSKNFSAEEEHIFELSPKDWTSLFLHSGWKVICSEVYYQYPRNLLILSSALSWFWRQNDFEGFWGAILEKDTSFSSVYQDWEHV